jgi:hypothetical protein
MIRTYRTAQNAGGSVTVESHGPMSRAWRVGRVAWALIFFFAAVICWAQGQWSAGGFALLVGAIVLPNYAKRRRPAH